jgi:Spy/CpxP family protein refolding chaperone
MRRLEQGALRAALIIGAAIFVSQSGFAQTANSASGPSIEQQVELLRKDVRSGKKQIIAANLKLTDKEAEKFWPIYDRYTADLVKVNDTKYALIKQYAEQYGSMKDEDLDKSAKQWLALDESVAQLRMKYLPTVRGVLSAKNTALFFQLDRRIVSIIDLQIAAAIPLVEP